MRCGRAGVYAHGHGVHGASVASHTGTVYGAESEHADTEYKHADTEYNDAVEQSEERSTNKVQVKRTSVYHFRENRVLSFVRRPLGLRGPPCQGSFFPETDTTLLPEVARCSRTP